MAVEFASDIKIYSVFGGSLTEEITGGYSPVGFGTGVLSVALDGTES